MPLVGEDKKTAKSKRAPKSTTKAEATPASHEPYSVYDEKDEPIVSAYTEEGQQRREEYEKSSKKHATFMYWLATGVVIAILVVVLIGCFTNWFQF